MSNNPFVGWKEKDVQDHNDRIARRVKYGITPAVPPPVNHALYNIGKPVLEPVILFSGISLSAGTRREVKKFVAKMTAIGAPRMTRADAWKKRPAVLRYFAARDQLRSFVPAQECPDELHWKAWLPMPESWSKAKKKRMDGLPHRQKCDRDNIDKFLGDGLFHEDKGVWGGSQYKFWCYEGAQRIEIEMVYYVKG